MPSSAAANGGVVEGAPPRLSIKGITKKFPGVLANDDVTLEVQPGEIVGILGENGAGKTTLMNIVSGLMQPDAGEICIDGVRAHIRNPMDSYGLGIGMVHQHLLLVPGMSVAENVAIGLRGRYPVLMSLGWVANRVKEVSQRYGLEVDPSAPVDSLSLGARQRVEIVKVLCHEPTLLVLDEPSSILTPGEWSDLAKVLRALAGDGRSIVFITHKLEELFEVTDRIYVMRDGSVVGEVRTAEADAPQLARMMVGREVVFRVHREEVEPGQDVLRVEQLGLERDGRRVLNDITFAVRQGEIFAIAGVDGNGQNELVEVIVGLARPTAGSVWFSGPVKDWDPRARSWLVVVVSSPPTATNMVLPSACRSGTTS